jgi:hypothetical protein
MKKILFLSVIAIGVLQARSQDEAIIIQGSKNVSKSMTPQQVIDSLNAHFPNADAVKYYKTSNAAARGWTVSKEDNLGSDQTIDYYTITFKREGLDYYGLFAADGRLIRSKQESTVDHLPDAVKTSVQALGAQHPGWKVTSKKYFKNLNASSMEEYYEVIAKNGDKTKSLYYKPDGTLMEIKD